MSSRNAVTIQARGCTKRFSDPALADRELSFYRAAPWAAPRLLSAGHGYLVMERLPISTDRPRHKPLAALISLLERLHEAGVNHRDVHAGNIVFHPTRGPLLIDWEHATTEIGEKSYDIFGPAMSQVEPPKGHRGDPGKPMWIGSDHRLSIKQLWA